MSYRITSGLANDPQQITIKHLPVEGGKYAQFGSYGQHRGVNLVEIGYRELQATTVQSSLDLFESVESW